MKTNYRRKTKRPRAAKRAGLVTKKLSDKVVSLFWENSYDGHKGAANVKRAVKRRLNRMARIDNEEVSREELKALEDDT